MVRGPLQPAVVVDSQGKRTRSPGKAATPQVQPGRIEFVYQGVNGESSTSCVCRFDGHGVWMEPPVYQSSDGEDVVSLH